MSGTVIVFTPYGGVYSRTFCVCEYQDIRARVGFFEVLPTLLLSGRKVRQTSAKIGPEDV